MGFSWLDFFFPNPEICVVCDGPLENLGYCRACRDTYALKVVNHGQCLRCGTFGIRAKVCDTCRDWPLYYEGNTSLWPYEGEVREAIAKFKYRGEPWRAQAYGALLAEVLPADTACLVPVPLAPDRWAERGYNQAALLCREIAKNRDLVVLERALVRKPGPGHQVGLSFSARKANLKNAFAPGPEFDRLQAPVVVVDDVLTSGATLAECIKVLHKHRNMHFRSLTLASAIR